MNLLYGFRLIHQTNYHAISLENEISNTVVHRCSQVSEASVVACGFSPCGQMFVTGCTRGDLKLWDTDVNLLSSVKDAHDLGVTCCCFAPQFNLGEVFFFFFSSSAQVSRPAGWHY